MQLVKKYFFILAFGLVSLWLYRWFFNIERESFYELLGVYSLLFIGFVGVFFKLKKDFSEFTFWGLVGFGILFRLITIDVSPNLSQDFYRFIWDGRLLLNGVNPYLYTPNEIIDVLLQTQPDFSVLYSGMGALSQQHYSNYPPLNQLIFSIAAFLGGGELRYEIIALRGILILADIATLLLSIAVLKRLKLPKTNSLLYFINPFIIIELSGNLHFEGLMACFIVGFVLLFLNKRIKAAALSLSAGVLTKLLPLLLLPFLIRKLRWSAYIGFCLFVGILCGLGFGFFYSTELAENYSQTIGLWFNNFEFNASVYYLFRTIGYWITGYNTIAITGKLSAAIGLLAMIYLAFRKQNKVDQNWIIFMLLGLSVYFLFSTTVHPWYLTSLLALSIFTPLRYVLVWTYLIFISYFTYAQPNDTESMVLITVQYLVVLVVAVYELRTLNLFSKA
ncbi:MAG: hypothetical protein RQ756_04815, partial [Flavobacteriaceae bacterium]|nr:hypothetical protein [Flavobacteriaceae bacterium]